MRVTLDLIESIPASKVSRMSEIVALNKTYLQESNVAIKDTIGDELLKLCIGHLKWLSRITPVTFDSKELIKFKKRTSPCIDILNVLIDQNSLDIVLKVVFPRWEI